MNDTTELRSVLEGLWLLSRESGARSLAELIESESKDVFDVSGPLQGPERAVLVGLSVASTLRRGLQARRALATLSREEVEQSAEKIVEPPPQRLAKALETAQAALGKLKTKLHDDIEALKRDFGSELPRNLASARPDDIKQHFVPFVEHAFRAWLKSELDEIERELSQVAERALAELSAASGEQATLSVLPELGDRALEINSTQRDFGVLAVSAVGVAVLFTNFLMGGALLALAPLLALYGREKSEAELRVKASAQALDAIAQAGTRLEHELGRRIDVFGERLAVLMQSGGERGRRGLHEMIEAFISERTLGSEAFAKDEGWQERLRELVARLEAFELESRGLGQDKEPNLS